MSDEATATDAPTMGSEDELYATLRKLGWHECDIKVRFNAARPEWRVTIEIFRPSYQQTFHGDTIVNVFTEAVNRLTLLDRLARHSESGPS